MSPLHLWAMIGAGVGLALPVVIHLLTRPRGERRALPTFQFLSQSANFSTRRSRLRAILILTTRALALGLLASGFARIAQRAASHGGGASTVLKRKVVVLDCSFSMRAVVNQVAVFDKARVMAQQVLAEDDTRAADLILATQQPHAVFGQTSSNLTALKDEAAKARALSEALNVPATLELAAASLAGLSEEELKACEVVIISDLQRSNWIKANFNKLPKDVPVRVLHVRDNAALGNLAIVKAGVNGLAEAGAPISVFAEVANFSALPAELELELDFDGRNWKRHVSVAAGARTPVAFELADVNPGWKRGEFKLLIPPQIQDALSDDNRYPLSVKVREARRVALITSERPRDVGGPAYFLERGLSASADASVQVARFLPVQLEGEVDETLQRSDLLAVVNAGQLSEGQTATLARLLSKGMPLLYVSQNTIDADNLKALQSALGASARLPVQFMPYKSAGKTALLSSLLGGSAAAHDDAGGRFLVWVDTARRPFKIFGDAVTRFTQTMRLTGGLASGQRDDAGLDSQSILARYSDGSAALLLAHVASGKLAILNVAVGGDERHLGAQAIFVPLIQELSQELLETDADSSGEMRISGVPLALNFKTAAVKKSAETSAQSTQSPVVVDTGFVLTRVGSGPIDLKVEGAPAFHAETSGASLTWARAGDPGVYSVEQAGSSQAEFAVVPPANDESDLAVLDEDVLKNRLAQDRTLTVVGAKDFDVAGDQAKETYDWFFGGALALLFIELGLLKIFKT